MHKRRLYLRPSAVSDSSGDIFFPCSLNERRLYNFEIMNEMRYQMKVFSYQKTAYKSADSMVNWLGKIEF
jgi:hypothetical protein